ncbi:MAG TPA: MFS transporter [Anaerolineales bacterium]|nr:MFS transporter [Anaerolineales bacterium]
MEPRKIYIGMVGVLREYGSQLKAFSLNARLYLLNVIVIGLAMGVFRLLFNFYILSLGYDEALLGKLVTTNSLTALIVALPSGYLADRMGRKNSLIGSGILSGFSILGMFLWPVVSVFYITNVLSGMAQSLGAVTMGPFLMENSGDHERTYLFSFSSGLQMASASVGNWIGGFLPTWISVMRYVEPTHSKAYGGAILVVSISIFIAILPLIFLKTPRMETNERSLFTPIQYAAENPGMLTRLILPMLLTSIGAGLIMPFMNVFYRQVHNQPDPVIGTLFAWGSLAMGIGLLVAPPLAERMGKIKFVVISQGLSIPFLILLGYAPWFWLSAASYYVRVALMNMSGPVYQTFVMEQVDASARATIASLVSMSWNFGWAFSPMISGWIQVRYGFGPVFLGTIVFYLISVWLYYVFFWNKQPVKQPATLPGD